MKYRRFRYMFSWSFLIYYVETKKKHHKVELFLFTMLKTVVASTSNIVVANVEDRNFSLILSVEKRHVEEVPDNEKLSTVRNDKTKELQRWCPNSALIRKDFHVRQSFSTVSSHIRTKFLSSTDLNRTTHEKSIRIEKTERNNSWKKEKFVKVFLTRCFGNFIDCVKIL